MKKNKDREEGTVTKKSKEIIILKYELSQTVSRLRARLLVLSFISLFSAIFGLKTISLSKFEFLLIGIVEAFYLTLFFTVAYLTVYFYFSITNDKDFFGLRHFVYKHGDKITAPYEETTVVSNLPKISLSGLEAINEEFLKGGFLSHASYKVHENKERKQYEIGSKEYYDRIELKYKLLDFGLPFTLGISSLIALYFRCYYILVDLFSKIPSFF